MHGTGTTSILRDKPVRAASSRPGWQSSPPACAPNPRRRPNLLELEQMNQVAQSAVIATVSGRPLERRLLARTKHAPRLSATSTSPPSIEAGICKASPQTVQYEPFSGCSASKQSSKTGSRETLRRGEPQIRQSAGKNVKNKVARPRLAKPTNPCAASLPTMVRRLALGSPYSKPSTATATAEDGLQHPAN